jgi:DNA-damage-inducible protein D
MEKEETHIAIFNGKSIRRKIVNNEWFFSVIDVVRALTESNNPRNYWSMLKIRERETSKIELSTNCVQLKLISGDGKEYETDCANTEGILRIIQSIPSKKVSHESF